MFSYYFLLVCVFVAITLPVGYGFVANASTQVPQQVDAAQLAALIVSLQNQTQHIQEEIQLKNDLTQFLQNDVRNMNATLTREHQERLALQNKVEQLEKSFNNEIASSQELGADVKSLKNQVTSLTNDLLATKHQLDIVNGTQTSAHAVFTQDIQTLSGNVAQLNSSLLILDNLVRNPVKIPVFFTFRMPDAVVPSNKLTPLKFQDQVSNEGNVYNAASGIASAPHPGIYWFGLTLSVDTTDYVSCYIVKNGRDYLSEVFSSVDKTVTASSAVTVRLNAGDTVQVAQCSGSGTFDKYKSSFTGIMIHKD